MHRYTCYFEGHKKHSLMQNNFANVFVAIHTLYQFIHSQSWPGLAHTEAIISNYLTLNDLYIHKTILVGNTSINSLPAQGFSLF